APPCAPSRPSPSSTLGGGRPSGSESGKGGDPHSSQPRELPDGPAGGQPSFRCDGGWHGDDAGEGPDLRPRSAEPEANTDGAGERGASRSPGESNRDPRDPRCLRGAHPLHGRDPRPAPGLRSGGRPPRRPHRAGGAAPVGAHALRGAGEDPPALPRSPPRSPGG